MKNSNHGQRLGAGSSKGFTLLEMLVAETVFLILLVLVGQLVFGVTQATQSHKKQMTASVDARQSLDRLSMDWAMRVRRNDVSAIFTKQSGNDEMGLLSQVTAYSGTRRLAALAYRVNPTTNVLERGVIGYNWLTSDPASDNTQVLQFPFTTMPTLATTNYETLGSTVFRFEFCYFRKVKADNPSQSPYTVDATLNLNSPDLQGIVIGIAVLDDQSRKLINAAQLATLTQTLPDVTADGTNPLALWTPVLNDPNFAKTANIPQVVAANVRIYQRIIYLND